MVTLDRQPASRKPITPWYDSESACLVWIALMFFVFIFGYVGWVVTHETAAYLGYAWAPIFLMTASGIVILSTTIRLVRRYAARRFQ